MRTTTTAQRNAVGAAQLATFGRLEITDPNGVWRDVTTSLSTPDWFNSASVVESIDSNTSSLTAILLRDTGALSLAPLMTGSTINRNSGGSYAPMLNVRRMWRVSEAVVAFGATPTSGDWKEIGTGVIDTIEVQDSSPTITITGRGMDAILLDAWIQVVRTYCADGALPVQTVIQQLIDDTLGTGADPELGGHATPYSSGITVYTPAYSPTFYINQGYRPATGNLMDTITKLAELAGMVFRYRYDASDVNRPTLMVPNRNASVADWSIGATEYLAIPTNRLDLTNVRNYIEVYYVDPSLGLQSVISPSSGTSDSITQFGKRYMRVDVTGSVQMTATNAQAMADAMRSDLEYPNLEQEFLTYAFWFVQLYDYGRLFANGVHYDTDQFGGVTQIKHDLANGTIRTTVGLKGKPSGRYTTWLQYNSPDIPDISPGGPDSALSCYAHMVSSTATTETIQVDVLNPSGGGSVALLSVDGSAQLLSGPSPGTESPSGTVWVFTRGAIYTGAGGAQFRATDSTGTTDDDQIVIEEQGRDTVKLSVRVEHLPSQSTPTTETYRCAVADPYPQGAHSVALSYQTGITGITPASPQTLGDSSDGGGGSAPIVTDSPNNVWSYPRDFTNAAWAKNMSTLATGATTGPDGISGSAAWLKETSGTGFHELERNIAGTAGQPTAIEYYVKAGGRSIVAVWGYDFGDSAFHIGYVDLTTGTVLSTPAGDSLTTADMGNGWWRITFIHNSIGTSVNYSLATATANGVNNFAGDTSKGIYVWGAQAELNRSSPSFNMLTPGTTGSRTITADINTTGYVDFVVPKPAAGTVASARVTFNATAAGRTSDSDSVDVPPQATPGPSLVVTPKEYADHYDIAWSGDGVQLSTDGGASFAAPPASPFTVARNSSGGATKLYLFTATKGTQTTSARVSIPPIGAAPVVTLQSSQIDRSGSAVTLSAAGINLPPVYNWAIYKLTSAGNGNFFAGATGTELASGNQSSSALPHSISVYPPADVSDAYGLILTDGSGAWITDTFVIVQPTLPGITSGGGTDWNTLANKPTIYTQAQSDTRYFQTNATVLPFQGDVVFTQDQTARFVRTNANGGAIRLRSNSGGTTDRGLQFGMVDNALNWTPYWVIPANDGRLLAASDALYDIGAAGASRPRNMYLYDSIYFGGAAYGPRFAYDNEVFSALGRSDIPHYGILWGTNSVNGSTPMMMFGAYGGISIFTSATERLRMGQDGNVNVFGGWFGFGVGVSGPYGYVASAQSANAMVNGSNAGDMCMRSENQRLLFSANAGANAQFVIAATRIDTGVPMYEEGLAVATVIADSVPPTSSTPGIPGSTIAIVY